MGIKHCSRVLLGVVAFLSLPGRPAAAQSNVPSLVSVSGRRLIVQKRRPDGSLSPAEPYVIRGVNWSPASKTTRCYKEPQETLNPDCLANRRAEFTKWAATDASAMQSLNINTVRVYLDPGLDATALGVLDTLWARGIMVILMADGATSDLARVQQVVTHYKNHPGVLMWMLGNEWNLNTYYSNPNCATPLAAAQCTQTAAQMVKGLDSNHPVATGYGEIDINAEGLRLSDTARYVNEIATSVDIWSLNIYRGQTFGTLFDQWRSITAKPMFLGEFGTDAFHNVATLADETMQAGWDVCLWNDAMKELSAVNPALVNLGGTPFEWNDEWWKVAGTDKEQNPGGFASNSHPDGFSNEEWFGLTDIDRRPRLAATALGQAFSSTYRRPPAGLNLSVVSRGAMARQYDSQYGVSRFYQCGKAFYEKTGGGGGGRGFNAVVLDAATGAQLLAPKNFDTYATRTACASNDPTAAMYGLVSYIQSAPAGSVIMLAVADEAGLNQDATCNPYPTSSCLAAGLSAIEALGSTKIRNTCFGGSWAMVAAKGKGVLAENVSANDLVSLQTSLPDPGGFSLSVSKSGTGAGTVTSDPPGLTCNSSCTGTSAPFSTGTPVVLTALATPGSGFLGWGGACSGTGICVLSADAVKSATATFTLGPEIPRLVNISTRAKVQTGDNVMIAGFIIGGNTPKKVLVTARGPSLAVPPFNVPGTLADPFMQLFSGATQIDSNDDYGSRPNAGEIPATVRPPNAKEAAIPTTLSPGAYTAIVTGGGGASGVAIVEVFEIDLPEIPLINISTRSRVETGDNVMIAGFIIQGSASKTVVVTARGPSLAVAPFNVPNTLADPYLRIYSGQTVIYENDNWMDGTDANLIPETQKPKDPKDAALRLTLPPGAYTAIVGGGSASTTSGIAIIEVFAQ